MNFILFHRSLFKVDPSFFANCSVDLSNSHVILHGSFYLFWFMCGIRVTVFFRIFTTAFLLFLAPLRGGRELLPCGHSLTPKVTNHPNMCKYEESLNFGLYP